MTGLKTTLVRTGLRVNSKKTTLMRINAFFRAGGIGAGLKTAETAEAKAGNQLKRDIGAGSRTQWRSGVLLMTYAPLRRM